VEVFALVSAAVWFDVTKNRGSAAEYWQFYVSADVSGIAVDQKRRRGVLVVASGATAVQQSDRVQG